MSLNIADKYLAKKEKDLFEYAKILETIISVENNHAWKTKKEFGMYAKGAIEKYVKKSYFTNNKNRLDPIEYSNDNINIVLKCIIDYLKETNSMYLLNECKDETFLLSVIICSSIYIDIASNFVDGDVSEVKTKFKYLLEYLKKSSILNIKNNKYFLNDLFEAAKKNASEERKAFTIIQSENYENKYKLISNDKNAYYEVDFSYHIKGLENYDENILKSLFKEYESKFLEISYNLLVFQILENLISDKIMPIYVIKINKAMKRAGIVKLFDNEYIKKYVRLLVPFDDEITYQNVLKEYQKINVPIMYDYKGVEYVKSAIFMDNVSVLVDKAFLESNAENEHDFAKRNISIVIRNKEVE